MLVRLDSSVFACAGSFLHYIFQCKEDYTLKVWNAYPKVESPCNKIRSYFVTLSAESWCQHVEGMQCIPESWMSMQQNQICILLCRFISRILMSTHWRYAVHRWKLRVHATKSDIYLALSLYQQNHHVNRIRTNLKLSEFILLR